MDYEGPSFGMVVGIIMTGIGAVVLLTFGILFLNGSAELYWQQHFAGQIQKQQQQNTRHNINYVDATNAQATADMVAAQKATDQEHFNGDVIQFCTEASKIDADERTKAVQDFYSANCPPE